jgi:hypothetical protein
MMDLKVANAGQGPQRFWMSVAFGLRFQRRGRFAEESISFLTAQSPCLLCWLIVKRSISPLIGVLPCEDYAERLGDYFQI